MAWGRPGDVADDDPDSVTAADKGSQRWGPNRILQAFPDAHFRIFDPGKERGLDDRDIKVIREFKFDPGLTKGKSDFHGRVPIPAGLAYQDAPDVHAVPVNTNTDRHFGYQRDPPGYFARVENSPLIGIIVHWMDWDRRIKMNNTAALAQTITHQGSKQTYYTARLMVDKDLTGDFFRSYAYFRWMDDMIDVHAKTEEERLQFIARQKRLIEGLYRNEQFENLATEEEIIADLIHNDRFEGSGLESFIRNMFAIVEFDAYRKGRLISEEELIWYTDRLGTSVTDGLLYFIGNRHPHPQSDKKYLAATAAHITHLLRDMLVDIADGFINIPREYLREHAISHDQIDSHPFRQWVQERVILAREYFREGKIYLDELDVLRSKIVGHWYCARFEGILDSIERDRYLLREAYPENRNLLAWLTFAWIPISVTLRHIARRLRGPTKR
jgi:phytoene/squalene synthetase